MFNSVFQTNNANVRENSLKFYVNGLNAYSKSKREREIREREREIEEHCMFVIKPSSSSYKTMNFLWFLSNITRFYLNNNSHNNFDAVVVFLLFFLHVIVIVLIFMLVDICRKKIFSLFFFVLLLYSRLLYCTFFLSYFTFYNPSMHLGCK